MNYFITVTDKGPTGVYVSRDLAERVKETRLGEVRHEVVECVPVDDISTGTCSRCGNNDTPVQRFCRGCMETSGWLSPEEAAQINQQLAQAQAACAWHDGKELPKLPSGMRSNFYLCFTIDNDVHPRVLVYDTEMDVWTSGGDDTQKVSRWKCIDKYEQGWLSPDEAKRKEGDYYALAEQLQHTKNHAKRLEAQVAAMRPLVELLECKCDTASYGGYTCPRCEALSTTAGQDLLARLERYERALALATPILTEVSKACCDMLDWDQIDADQVNAALNACSEALKGTP